MGWRSEIESDFKLEDAKAEIKRLGDLCDQYAEFIAERGLWSEFSVWQNKQAG